MTSRHTFFLPALVLLSACGASPQEQPESSQADLVVCSPAFCQDNPNEVCKVVNGKPVCVPNDPCAGFPSNPVCAVPPWAGAAGQYGLTYGNVCLAHEVRAVVAFSGPCPTAGEPCPQLLCEQGSVCAESGNRSDGGGVDPVCQ
jgi:hypothetical protein